MAFHFLGKNAPLFKIPLPRVSKEEAGTYIWVAHT